MKKTFTKFALASLMMAGALGMNAAEKGVDLTNDLGEITPNETYALAAEGDYYTFNPAEAGPVTVQTNYTGSISSLVFTGNNSSYFIFYSFTDFYMQQDVAYTMVENVGWAFTFEVDTNHEYIIGYTDLLPNIDNFEFTLSTENLQVDATLTYCFPEPGTTFDEGLGINDVVLEFDQPIASVENIYLSYTDKEGEVKTVDVPRGNDGYELNNLLLIIRIANTNNIYNTVKQDADYAYPIFVNIDGLMCKAGPVGAVNLQAGNEFVTIGENGNISIEYELMDAVRLVSVEWPETIYSYFPEGCEAGLATLTFNGPVTARAAQISMIMGTHYRGSASGEEEDPSWNLPTYLNEDRTVLTVDFTGIDFGAQLISYYNTVTVMISNILGENGMIAILTPDESSFVSTLDKFL
ncbi:MAG: hypothetical protein J1E82_07360, partial [Muribaculaceae bacterium]|nr:hypothetical protein [Muribaculaceae bacterium]